MAKQQDGGAQKPIKRSQTKRPTEKSSSAQRPSIKAGATIAARATARKRASKAIETTDVPKTSNTLKVSELSDIPDIPDIPDVFKMPHAPYTSDKSNTSAAFSRSSPSDEPNTSAAFSRSIPSDEPDGRTSSVSSHASDAPPASALKGKPKRKTVSRSSSKPGSPSPAKSKPSSFARSSQKGHTKRGKFVVRLILCVAVGAVLITAALFSWDRWFRYDDAADFEGTWYANGTSSQVFIDDQTIRLTDDVAYSYTLDTTAKTISYTFGPKSGSGRYYFTDERTCLVIIDGQGYTALSTLVDDLGRGWNDFIFWVQQKDNPPSLTEDTTILTRTQLSLTTNPSAEVPGGNEEPAVNENIVEQEAFSGT